MKFKTTDKQRENRVSETVLSSGKCLIRLSISCTKMELPTLTISEGTFVCVLLSSVL